MTRLAPPGGGDMSPHEWRDLAYGWKEAARRWRTAYLVMCGAWILQSITTIYLLFR